MAQAQAALQAAQAQAQLAQIQQQQQEPASQPVIPLSVLQPQAVLGTAVMTAPGPVKVVEVAVQTGPPHSTPGPAPPYTNGVPPPTVLEAGPTPAAVQVPPVAPPQQ
jgi:hypothetical protein